MDKNKKKKGTAFSTKLLLTIGSLLFLILAAMITTINIVTNVYTKNYVEKDLHAKQIHFESSLDSLIYNSNASVLTLFSEENFYQVISASDKNEAFQKIYDVQSLPPALYFGISYYQDEKLSFYADNYDDTEAVLPYIDNSIYQKAIEAQSSSPIIYGRSTYDENGKYLILGKKIEITGQNPGACFVYLNEEAVSRLMKNIVTTNKSLLIDSERYIVSSYQASDVGSLVYQTEALGLDKGSSFFTATINGTKSFVSVERLDGLKNYFALSWQIVSFEDYSTLFHWLDLTTIFLWATAGAVFLAAIIVSFRLSSSLSKPLRQLSSKVESFNLPSKAEKEPEEQKEEKEPSKGGDEIAQLEDSYQQMIKRINDLMEENIKEMDEKRALELDSLQMQINPHFLYNTLDAIAWMAKIQKEDQIESLVMSLAKFFRLSLHNGDKIITVGEEIELTKHYLEIQKARFPDRFEMVFEIDKEVESYKTLKLILQPIVENAIKYGLDSPDHKGILSIRAKKEGDDIVFEVEDNGEGFDVPEDIFQRKKQATPNSRSGFGLFNVQERISLEYGKNYGVKIISSKGHGTKVILRIPTVI
ncbi:MAG: sensor histidine kinase [Bacilli bacterium]|jgi:two-component system sensor histidine kinase YesM|nr:sensor histidine kinase [Bacilli bacterium]